MIVIVNRWRRFLLTVIPILLMLACASPALSAEASSASGLEARLGQLQLNIGTSPAVNNGDNAWLLVSSALVLMMTAPGLILFYGGLVRQKNVLGTMMHSLVLMAVVTIIWA